MSKRVFLKVVSALALTSAMGAAMAQSTAIKFQLDWRFEGTSALFLSPAAKGMFKDANLDIGHLRHGICRHGRPHGVSRQQPGRTQ